MGTNQTEGFKMVHFSFGKIAFIQHTGKPGAGAEWRSALLSKYLIQNQKYPP